MSEQRTTELRVALVAIALLLAGCGESESCATVHRLNKKYTDCLVGNEICYPMTESDLRLQKAFADEAAWCDKHPGGIVL